ncbi:MAG TPA: monofunctional biosynthetic peptidoglycan transglycosylase [Thermoanaerobaculia bacterium]|nr:monofunctional biosynthetic peptidoglycan transglycosylase [Thermoanaerobaculia bacterium]
MIEPTSPPVLEPRPKRGCVRRFWLPALVLFVAYLGWKAITWPDVAALAKDNPKSTAFIDSYRDRWFFPDREVEWKWVPYSRISRNLRRAVLVGEDATFFGHEGFDTDEMRDAITKAIEKKRLPRGASTITQQLAKNLWLSSSRNPLRKIEEVILTRQLEAHLKKKRILEIYLNVVELGPGIYGAEAASRHYFGRSAAGLSPHQAAQLAGSLPAPKTWHPGSDSKRYLWHVRWIERRMWRTGWVSGRV